jgi:hypothetical protein
MKNALLVFALLVAGFYAVGLAMTYDTTHASHMTYDTTPRHTTQNSTVVGPPSLSVQFINAVLCNASSPACGTGLALYDGSVTSGIDDVYALAFFKHESSYGRYGIARENLGLGNIRCTAGYVCKSGFRAYASWAEGYQDWYKLIGWYVGTLHKSTVAAIVTTYAPSSENDTSAYIQSVESSVQAWRQ